MSSLGVKLPLARDAGDGYGMIKSFKTMIRQNFKMLILTSPGERIMEPNFGVGLKKYLFENFNESVFAKIERDIFSQTQTYLPVININEIRFNTALMDENQLGVQIRYSIPNLNIQDLLEFTI
jgi:phage baseplate assembly protein W